MDILTAVALNILLAAAPGVNPCKITPLNQEWTKVQLAPGNKGSCTFSCEWQDRSSQAFTIPLKNGETRRASCKSGSKPGEKNRLELR